VLLLHKEVSVDAEWQLLLLEPVPPHTVAERACPSFWESNWLFIGGQEEGEEDAEMQQHPFKLPLLTGACLSHYGPARGTSATLLG